MDPLSETSPKRFFIVAGETSGDMHGARLMHALRKQFPDCIFEGIGGGSMEQEGLQSIVSLDSINVVGFWEVAKKYRFFSRLLSRCSSMLVEGNYDAFLPIDYPGFNLRLATQAKQQKIPVLYYIAPQLWAWGIDRAKKLRAAIDLLMVVFPFEEQFFQSQGINTVFVGHPLLDNPVLRSAPKDIEEREPLIALFPGSRKQEIRRHTRILLPTAQRIHKKLSSMKFAVAVAPDVKEVEYAPFINSSLPITLEYDARSLMQNARAGIVKTGTSTLEAALCSMPFVMFYKTSPISYHIAKHKITLPYIALVNIIAEKLVVPELIQQEASPAMISHAIVDLLLHEEVSRTQQNKFTAIRSALGSTGASERAATAIAQALQ